MEMILLKDVEKVGRKGDVVRVKDGFGRNFLIPRGLGLVSSEANKRFLEQMKRKADIRLKKEKAAAGEIAEKLKALNLKIEAQVGDQGKLFGSVTSEEISVALKDQGHSFSKKQIHLRDSIRKVGIHPVSVEVYPQIKAEFSIEVVPKT